MTIKLISILAFLIQFLNSGDMRHDPIGKTYKALINETCKEMSDGGCMIYTYQILNFSQDSVAVSYQVIASCSPKERESSYNRMYNNSIKNYKWSANNDSITIEGLNDYGKLQFQNSILIGEDKFKKRNIEFNEVAK
jgi:hypothetical protein